MRKNTSPKVRGKSMPPGRIKITRSLITLLETKEFSAITTAEIARNAGVTEALIYKYFKDKRDLLHTVLSEYLKQYDAEVKHGLKGIKGAQNKLRKLIWAHIDAYASNRVFARIFLLEVRNYPEFFSSEAYEQVKNYSQELLTIIEEGVREGEFRDDMPPKLLRQCVQGCIEQVCMTGIIFGREISPDPLTDDLCEFVFGGLLAHAAPSDPVS